MHIVRIGRHLKLIYLIIVESIVGLNKMLVVWLTDVEQTFIFAIDEMGHRLTLLTVDVYS